MNATNGYNFELDGDHDSYIAQNGCIGDSGRFTSPLEILAASLKLPTFQHSQSNPPSLTSSINLKNALKKSTDKVSDLDTLVGEFNDLMSSLQEPLSPTRLNVSPVPPKSHLDDPLNNEEFIHELRDCSDNDSFHKIDYNLDAATIQKSSGRTDDDAMIATIRTLSEMQMDATSNAETGAIQNEISAQMMHMYSNNVRKICTPERIANRVPGRSSLDLKILSYRDQSVPTPDRSVLTYRNAALASTSTSPDRISPYYRPTASSSILFPSSSTSVSASTHSMSHVGWDPRIRKSDSPHRTVPVYRYKKENIQVL